jgi:hypothetical protein
MMLYTGDAQLNSLGGPKKEVFLHARHSVLE